MEDPMVYFDSAGTWTGPVTGPELGKRKVSDDSTDSASSSEAWEPPRRGGRKRSEGSCNPELFKTELCRSWMETGKCRYGSKCQFAHGQDELRPVQRHPKFKTQICRTFHTIGSCPYGCRCRFIHLSPDETLTPEERQLLSTDDTNRFLEASQFDSYATEYQRPEEVSFNPFVFADMLGGGDPRMGYAAFKSPSFRRLPVFRRLSAGSRY